MGETAKTPGYMAQLLEALGWNQGTRIPLADPANQELESQLINRQNELQRLKEDLLIQNQKRSDLDKYKSHVFTEYQENTRLLFAHKQQLEQEVKFQQLFCNEANHFDRDAFESNKESKEINSRIERLQNSIARLLKKADNLKTDVCGERGALQEWRAALERNASDITAIEQFTKQDTFKAKELETKRQKLKLEHDRMHERLVQLVSNLSAEERACDRISIQVIEGMEQRKQMMIMWTGAVENLRQRDADIRHIREDYAVLEAEANNVAEKCREQQTFCEQQRGNNNEALRENMALSQQLSDTRAAHQRLIELNAGLNSEVQALHRELSNLRGMVEKLHIENKHIMEEQHRRDLALELCNNKIKDLKQKLIESTDKTKTSEKRAKELEDMLNEEERYASQVTTNQQRAMHCSFVEQQKLLELKNEEKLFRMQLKASIAVMNKLDYKQKQIEKNLQLQKESLYAICYQVETIGARVCHMEGAQAERDSSAVLLDRENRLKDVCAVHAARVALLERHSARLHDDMRRLTRELESTNATYTKLQSRLKSSMLTVMGGDKELQRSRDVWRRERVEEALMRLRVAHAERALAGLDDAGFGLDEQRLHIDAAMNERIVEINARRDIFNVQKRALIEDCGKLRSEIREREQRIEQLKKRYDIFIGSLGKDDSGQQLSVTYFKIKFAAERAELRERGAALDADIGRRERDVSALEATLRVVHHAHAHFLNHISPLSDDTPEIEELNKLTAQYYELRDELKQLSAKMVELEQAVNDVSSRHTVLTEKNKQLQSRQSEAEQELENSRERMQKQEGRLQNAHDIVRQKARRAKKLVDGVDSWRIFQLSIWCRDYSEAASAALTALYEACRWAEGTRVYFASLLASTDLQRYVPQHQRRLLAFINKITTDKSSSIKKDSDVDIEESVFSSSSSSVKSGVSVASGFTKRLAGFRRDVASKVNESSLVDATPEQARRSTVSLRVITLGIEENVANMELTKGILQSRGSLNKDI